MVQAELEKQEQAFAAEAAWRKGEALAGYPEGSRGGEMTTAMPTRIA